MRAGVSRSALPQRPLRRGAGGARRSRLAHAGCTCRRRARGTRAPGTARRIPPPRRAGVRRGPASLSPPRDRVGDTNRKIAAELTASTAQEARHFARLAEIGIARAADRRRQRDRLLGYIQYIAHFFERHRQFYSKFLRCPLAADLR